MGLSQYQENYKFLREWNKTAVNYPPDICLHQLFEAQVERTPKKNYWLQKQTQSSKKTSQSPQIDWSTILLARAKELKSGGQIVTANL
ncbi:hypothetical protein CYANOKiyG1_69160 [Okeania sp. KiyG1]|nr:hypothetical protein CYANOKiyG1_69160 [Okeania sp. KiyG1]